MADDLGKVGRRITFFFDRPNKTVEPPEAVDFFCVSYFCGIERSA
jgi:hypothetical protein